MRHLAFLISMIMLIGCKSNSAPSNEASSPAQAPAQEQQKASTDVPAQFLLTSAATDFKKHGPPSLHFRDVHIGYDMTKGGEKQYMLCGEFLPAQAKDKAEGTPFVTIKTSGYEQYVGDQVTSRCKRPSIIWEKEDMSTSLQGRFESLP